MAVKSKNVSIWENIYNNLVSQGLLNSESGSEFIYVTRYWKPSSATLKALSEHCDLFVEPIYGLRVFTKESKLFNNSIRANMCSFFGEYNYFEYSEKYYPIFHNPEVYGLISKCRTENEEGRLLKIIDCNLRYDYKGDETAYQSIDDKKYTDYMINRNYVCKVLYFNKKKNRYVDNLYFWMDRVI